MKGQHSIYALALGVPLNKSVPGRGHVWWGGRLYMLTKEEQLHSEILQGVHDEEFCTFESAARWKVTYIGYTQGLSKSWQQIPTRRDIIQIWSL